MLKHGDTFAVFDRFGDMRPVGLGEQGVYHRGTRHLSALSLRLQGTRPLLLSSNVREDNALLTVDLSNPDVEHDGDIVLARDTLHVFRGAMLWDGVCHTKLRVKNYGMRPVEVAIDLGFDADFRDIFEIRGSTRAQRGRMLEPRIGESTLELGYRGLDDVERRTIVDFEPVPQRLTERAARFEATLAPHAEVTFTIAVRCEAGARSHTPTAHFDGALERTVRACELSQSRDAGITTSNEQLNAWINRSRADVHLMITDTPHGPYPYAGIPWFSCPFGRDGIITALQFLWVNPGLARGVLAYLAATQSDERDPERDAEPGKILHETREGEMAALGEIPFRRYYGTVDATPLFVLLAGEYYVRTGDLAFIQSIWRNIERALTWMDEDGDRDRDGFVEYARQGGKGLVTQGWRDSFDAIFHDDGQLAEGPITLCEVQAYVYGAKRAAALLAGALGQDQRARGLEQQAEQLRARFEEVFWSDAIGTYVLALDGKKRPCRVRSSAAGHCLLTGIVSPARAKKVADALLGESAFSGWGIRTIPCTEARYNPMSYHNGSVWPHDNALIAAGFARYGLTEPLERVFSALFDASTFVELHRMPELYCGFTRRPAEGPTRYPVACAPQAWAAGSAFLLLGACLGLRIDARVGRVVFDRPTLPRWLDHVELTGLAVGEALVDVELDRRADDVAVHLVRRQGEVQIVVVK